MGFFDFFKPRRTAPMASATVTTPLVPLKPKGYLWDKLNAAQDRDQVLDVYNEARKHGYGEEGQLMKAIKERLK